MEKQFGFIEIEGEKIPLNFSIRASRRLSELPKRGDTPNVLEAYEDNLKFLSILLQDAAEYKKEIEGEEIRTFTPEQLALCLSPADIPKVVQAINETIKLGSSREVKAKPGKNAEAAPATKEA